MTNLKLNVLYITNFSLVVYKSKSSIFQLLLKYIYFFVNFEIEIRPFFKKKNVFPYFNILILLTKKKNLIIYFVVR